MALIDFGSSGTVGLQCGACRNVASRSLARAIKSTSVCVCGLTLDLWDRLFRQVLCTVLTRRRRTVLLILRLLVVISTRLV